ncbi:MAG: DUF2974 domain-containing protein [Clostridia bacterium]|nr:DUF2974 domain-containing protein [Clostridia bacterium]
MGSLFDYLNWRGDLSFSQAEINEVDGMIFSLLSYIDFSGIASTSHEESCAIPLRSVVNSYFTKHPDPKKINLGLMVPRDILKLLRVVKDTVRFRSVGVKAHVSILDPERQMQFSATTFTLGECGEVVAFRGTDDTIVGWKENFNMSFMEVVPAQTEAVSYLAEAAAAFKGRISLAGHSKGGNLAIYAAARSTEQVQDRLTSIWSYDGPGFFHKMLNDPAYIRIRPIIRTLIPQSAVVGLLLEHEENYVVVKSRQRGGVLQHDGMTWEIVGSSFVHLRHVTGDSRRLDRTLNQLIHSMSLEQREQFTESIYQLLSANNALTLTELVSMRKKWIENGRRVDPKVYRTILGTLTALINLAAKNFWDDIRHKN